MFDCKHPASSAETGHYFIDNQQRIGAIAPFADGSQGSRRPKAHPARALNQRFHHHGGSLGHLRCGKIFQGLHIWNFNGGKIPVAETKIEHCGGTQACCACRIAMITALKSHKLMFSRISQAPILTGDS